MLTTPYQRGQINALRTLGLTKHAADLVQQLQAAEGAAARGAAAAGAAGAAKAPGLLAKLRGAPMPLKGGLALGGLLAAGLAAHDISQPPQMEVVPSAPLAPLYS